MHALFWISHNFYLNYFRELNLYHIIHFLSSIANPIHQILNALASLIM